MKISPVKLQRGVSLIEVLVTVLILSTALMGLAALQSRSLQYNQGAYFRSQANIMANDILDRMRVYTSDSTWKPSSVVGLPQVSAAEITDINLWKKGVKDSLPGGEGAISCALDTRICTAEIKWNDLNDPGKSAEDKSTFVYTAML